MFSDFRHAIRVLVKSPGVSTLIVLVLAVGIGANTAMFSIIHGVLLRPLPYADSAQLVAIRSLVRGKEGDNAAVPDVVDFRAQSRSLAAIAAYTDYRIAMTGRAHTRRRRERRGSGGRDLGIDVGASLRADAIDHR
ncbi:MAG: hypothetical protein DMF98_14645 [Acidobacteria bacterium]|nr:MAG: hypothetical protein DMF98_14645 [Acidobacteriota bacterium]